MRANDREREREREREWIGGNCLHFYTACGRHDQHRRIAREDERERDRETEREKRERRESVTMTLLAECPVHELTVGLGKGANGDADGTWEEKRELKALLQPSRNWPMHQAQCYAHQDCNLRIKRGCRYLLHGRNGVGKSTLLSAIANRDNGLQSFPKEVDTFLLDQELGFLRNQEDNAVIDIVLEHASR